MQGGEREKERRGGGKEGKARGGEKGGSGARLQAKAEQQPRRRARCRRCPAGEGGEAPAKPRPQPPQPGSAAARSRRLGLLGICVRLAMSYPQGYLYQPSASLALYSCPAYSTSVISGPRTDELGRSSSGSAFSPYAGSTAFTAPSPGYNSHLQYGTDPAAAAAAAFTSYVVRATAGSRHRAGHDGIRRVPVVPPRPPGLLFVPILFLRSRGQKGARLPASPPNFPASPPCPASHCCWRQRRAGPGAEGAAGMARASRTRAGGDRLNSL